MLTIQFYDSKAGKWIHETHSYFKRNFEKNHGFLFIFFFLDIILIQQISEWIIKQSSHTLVQSAWDTFIIIIWQELKQKKYMLLNGILSRRC